MNMVRATLVYVFVAVYILILSPIGLAWALLSGDSHLIFSLARFCIRVAGLMAGVTVRIRGKEKILPGCTYVFLSNHQGNIDAPVLPRFYCTGSASGTPASRRTARPIVAL